MAPTNRRPGGWTVPGFKYLGPFNPLNNGDPINEVDKIAQTHDRAYQSYIDAGINPYLNFNKADSDFIESLSKDSSVAGWLGKSAFKLKRVLLPHLDKQRELAGGRGGKKPKLTPEQAQKRKYYFSRQYPRKPKEAKTNNTNMGDAAELNGVDGGDGGGQARAGGGGGSGVGGSGGGGHGVGVSTGGWKAGTVFSGNKIITTSTRQFYAPIYNDHLYKRIWESAPSSTNKTWVGISTPWGFFNFNEYDAHFSPGDWQTLVNTYAKWRPVHMHVKIYNLQIKQKVILGADTLYNNDLTAGVHIFCDGSHQFPYSQHPWDHGTMPELPYDTWKIPQYAYFQMYADLEPDDSGNQNLNADNVEKNLTRNAPFFVLESATHEVLGTGEETEFNFDFECGWVNNTRAYSLPQSNFNPLVKTRRYYPVYQQDAASKFGYRRYSPYSKPSNWMPGPSIGYLGNTDSNQDNNHGTAARGPITVCPHPYFTTPSGSTRDPQSATNIPDRGGVQKGGYDVAPTNGACSRLDSVSLSFDATEKSTNEPKLITRNIDMDLSRFGSVWAWDGLSSEINSNGQVQNTPRQNLAQLKNIWMYPNQAWDSTPICRNNPIWDKLPNTDKHTMVDSSDGTLAMAHPPGTIFIKVAKVPVPTDNNADAYLTLYVTGQVTCTIEWEAEMVKTKNWRPELRISANQFTDAYLYNVNENGIYNTPETFTEAMPTRYGMNKNM
uniref:Minor capsid protein VP1 n=1 Tax=Feline bocavirus TaxID=1174530 RepID=A0A346D7G3_9VIRU|nr:VP1 [Feline bocavirus]